MCRRYKKDMVTTPFDLPVLYNRELGSIWLTEFLVDKNRKLKEDVFDTIWQKIVTWLDFDRSGTTGFMRFTLLIY